MTLQQGDLVRFKEGAITLFPKSVFVVDYITSPDTVHLSFSDEPTNPYGIVYNSELELYLNSKPKLPVKHGWLKYEGVWK